jgi:glycosyltransferase involved in cell wall biosynthesis
MARQSGDSGGETSVGDRGIRPAALLLSPEPPYPAVGGGALRTASLLEYLGRRYALDLIVFRDGGAPDPASAVPRGLVRSLYVIDLPRHSRRPLARYSRNLVRLVRGRPPLNDRFSGSGREIRSIVDGKHYHLAVLEHFWSAPYLEQVAPHCPRVILDLHNIESMLLAGYAGVARWPLSSAFRRFHTVCRAQERRWLPQFRHLLAASEDDVARLRILAPGCSASVYPNSIPALERPLREEDHAIAFSGNLAYPPNTSAVRFFRRKVWPILREKWPGLVWRVLGKNPEAVSKDVIGDPRVEVMGPVPDAVEALASAKVVVVPILTGSGTRVKILEAWAAARAVVSTRVGVEGLPARNGEHLLVADDPGGFAEAVSRLLESEEIRRDLGEGGRNMYLREFTWQSAWAALERMGI